MSTIAHARQEKKQYILAPMNGYVRLVMNKDVKEANFKVPRFDVRAAIENIAVSLSEAQYEDLLAAVSSISIAQVRSGLTRLTLYLLF